MTVSKVDPPAKKVAAALQGFYKRVGIRLGVDPSFVSSVARGESKSQEVEAALEAELRDIVKELNLDTHSTSRAGA